MTNAKLLRSRLAAAAFLSASLLAPASVALAKPAAVAPGGPRVEVTQRDVDRSNEKVAMAYSALVDMSTEDSRNIGERFVPPRIVRFKRGARTACGNIGPNNAKYCPNNNTILYDEVFVAGMAKTASNAMGTDGDMASVGVIAHEIGHAVAMQLGHARGIRRERIDCRLPCRRLREPGQERRAGSLEDGDVEEAYYAMSIAGDPRRNRQAMRATTSSRRGWLAKATELKSSARRIFEPASRAARGACSTPSDERATALSCFLYRSTVPVIGHPPSVRSLRQAAAAAALTARRWRS